MARLGFRRDQRLQHAREYEAVRSAKRTRARGPVVCAIRPTGGARWRLGLQVGRAVGGAVERNRIKRLIREAFRLSQHEFPMIDGGGCDLVVSVRGPTRLGLPGFSRLLTDAARSLADGPGGDAR